jgi:hypothetical protein
MILLAYLVVIATSITWGLAAVAVSLQTEPWKSVSIMAAKLAVSDAGFPTSGTLAYPYGPCSSEFLSLTYRSWTVLRSDVGGIALTSLLFGLAHAPGLYLRPGMTQEAVGAHPWLMAVGYSIVITSVAGVLLGVLGPGHETSFYSWQSMPLATGCQILCQP